jgi:hypothetical protein
VLDRDLIEQRRRILNVAQALADKLVPLRQRGRKPCAESSCDLLDLEPGMSVGVGERFRVPTFDEWTESSPSISIEQLAAALSKAHGC